MPTLVKKVSKGGTNLSWDLSGVNNTEAGTFPAIIADILVAEGIEKTVYGGTDTEVITACRFLIAYTNDDGEVSFVQTKEMRESADERSNLMKFLTNARGKVPPLAKSEDDEDQYDYLVEIGRLVSVTVEVVTSQKGTTYGRPSNVSPLPKKLQEDAPDINELEIPSGRRSPIPKGLVKEEEQKEEKSKKKKDPF